MIDPRLKNVGIALLIVMSVVSTITANSARAASKVHFSQAKASGKEADEMGERNAILNIELFARDSATAAREIEYAAFTVRAVADMDALRIRASRQDEQVTRMVSELTPEILVLVQPLLDEFEIRIAQGDSLFMVAIDRAERAEARADSLLLWGQGFKDSDARKKDRIEVILEQVESLEAGSQLLLDAGDHSFWVFPEPEWWMVAGSFIIGVVVTNRD